MGQSDRAKQILAEMMMFVEATALSGGHDYSLGWLLCAAELEIPWESLLEKPVDQGNIKGLMPLPKMAHPNWVSTNFGYVQDLDGFQERTAKLKARAHQPAPRNQQQQQQTQQQQIPPDPATHPPSGWHPKKK